MPQSRFLSNHALPRFLPLFMLVLAWCLPTAAVSLPPDDVEHLIVTSEPLAGELQRLADYWIGEGVSSSVVTLNWIQDQVEPGNDLAETIRAFLRLAYDEWGVRSVVLGGDTDVLPVRLARSDFYPFGSFTDIATDLYYASLDGDWDADGDGIYGEIEDDVDLTPELSVGRAPIDDVTSAAVFVDKTLAYLEALAGAERQALILAEVLFPADWNPEVVPTFDGAALAQEYALLLELAEPPFVVTRRYENYPAFPDALPLTKALALEAMSSGDFPLVHAVGHGHLDQVSLGDGLVGPGDVASLQNDPPFFVLAMFPSSAAIDQDCLLEDFVQNPVGGAAIALGASAEVFPSISHEYQLRIYTEAIGAPTVGVGEALRRTWEYFAPDTESNGAQRWQQLSVNLLGDPRVPLLADPVTDTPSAAHAGALELYPCVPNPFNPTVNISFRLGDGLPGAVATVVEISDLSGRVVATLLDEQLVPDRYEVTWSGNDAAGRPLASGIYLVAIRAGDLQASGKVTLLK